MTFSGTIDTSPHDSDESSYSDEDDSSVVQVSPPSEPGSHDYEWAHLSYPDELNPSDSASRARTSSHRSRNPIRGSRSASGRRHSSRRHVAHERDAYSQRPRRHRSPELPESPDSAEEYESGAYTRASKDRRIWPHAAQVHGPGYAHSSSSDPSYNVYAHGPSPHGPFVYPGVVHGPSDQLVRLGHPTQTVHYPSPYMHAPYPYNVPFQNSHSPAVAPAYLPEQSGAYPDHVSRQRSSSRARGDDRRTGSQPPLPHVVHHGGVGPYGMQSLSAHELMPYGGPGGYYPFRPPYMLPGMVPGSYFAPQPQPIPRQETEVASPTPSDAQADAASPQDEALARLEKLILEERTEREARQAALEKEAAEKAEREQRAAHDKKIADEAAALARAEAEKKAAEDVAKVKKEAEEAAAAAAAAAEAAAEKPPPEKKKPLKFKDAVGRKFSFPFELCCTWQGMEELIRQAFLHVEVIGPHVAEGHYDLVGPNGEIILPQVWETVVEPDWTITMHMWPIPEKPKSPEPAPPPPPPAPADAGASGGPVGVIVEEPKKKADSAGSKKARPKPPEPSTFAMWMLGSNRLKPAKVAKIDKKPPK